jgi:tyrosine-protein kinase Etk/Wzc
VRNFINILISFISAFVFLRYSSPSYRASATIMIKDNKNSGISAELAAFEDLGIIGGSSANNPENEIEILKSRKIIGYVVDSLNMDVSYFVRGRLKNTEIYDKSPLKINFSYKNTEKKIETFFSVIILN